MSFVEKLNKFRAKEGEIGLFWLGQAGFLLKNSRNELLAVDPYLSDAVERICGLKRLMMPVLSPEELNPDYFLISHHDEDHLDMDIIPDIMSRNLHAKLLSSAASCEICRKSGIAAERIINLEMGSKTALGGFRIEAVFADHGDHAEDAIGMLVETDGIILYFTGDTSFQCKRMQYAASQNVDLLIFPINGEYGNMNSYEAVELVKLVKPRLAIPSHFWTFMRHGGDPYTFDREMRIEAPEIPFYFMCQGELLHWKKRKGVIGNEINRN